MTNTNRTRLIPLDEFIEKQKQDPVFRAEWDRTELARSVALKLVHYRSENNLTQAQLARTVGMAQPMIARLESGNQPPSTTTLQRIAAHTGLRFTIDISEDGIALSA